MRVDHKDIAEAPAYLDGPLDGLTGHREDHGRPGCCATFGVSM